MHFKTYEWNDHKKFIALSNLITGDILKTLHEQSPEGQNHESLKSALFTKYKCTAQEYHRSFRQAIPLDHKTKEFVTRLELLLDPWLELKNCKEKTFDLLRDLMLREQVYNSLNERIVTFVKERKPKDVQAVKTIVNNYCEVQHQSTRNLERLVGNNTVRNRAVAGFQKEGKMLGRELWYPRTSR
ncbi:reverse transcriptase [Plakobranchus ocellatus]|uniref:Reverse transcriptase n=1 Tax=Plakobranchus ocellatus TaxID=259542 RepID=A0AAV4E1Q7_9GAST|nr:reverse transcriptase [Plakobranchus ocellatus]